MRVTPSTNEERKDPDIMKSLRQIILGIALSAVLLFGFGCVAYKYKPGFNFSRFHTYALLPLPTQGPSLDPGAPNRLAGAAREGVTESLSHKGFSEATPETADFLVKFEVYYRLQHGEYGRSEFRQLTIQILDRQSQEVVWSNSMSSTARYSLTPDALSKYIVGLLEPFPPGAVAPK
jgi:hypothetical protein